MEKVKINAMCDRGDIDVELPVSLIDSRVAEFARPKMTVLSTPSSPKRLLKGLFVE